MSDEREVLYWQGFIDRESNYDYSLYFLSIKDLQIRGLRGDLTHIENFHNNFLDRVPLCGTNKQSFENSFERFSFWHYHIGEPYNNHFDFYHGKKCYKDFQINKEQACEKCINLEHKQDVRMESSKVIYYVKFSENIIGIVGYGLKHNPFPKLTDKAIESIYNASREDFD